MEPGFWLKLNGDLWLVWGAYWIIAATRTLKTQKTESPLQRARHLVWIVLAFTLCFYLDHWPEPFRQGLLDFPAREPIGCAITLIGLGYAVWARIHLGKYWSGNITIKEGHKIIRSGPYAFTRHPIYTGFIFAFFGTALTNGHLASFVGFLLVPLAFRTKIRREESALVSQFGREYEDYRREVKALIPGLF